MNRLRPFCALIALVCVLPAWGNPPCVNAVVRIPSHGASATVIETGDGYAILLGCAHAFEGKDRHRPITLDIPVKQPLPEKAVKIALLAVDYGADLSLIRVEHGPLPFAAPVAPVGHRPGKHILSVGYDAMRWPARVEAVAIVAISPATIFTRERPGHGRSGGALLDAEAGLLIGVVQGYELAGQRRGLYVGHAAILQFLKKQGRPAAAPVRPMLNCPT
jgi:hypothetical protein